MKLWKWRLRFEIFLIFLNFREIVRQLIHNVFFYCISRALYLCWIEPMLKSWNVSLFYVRDCRPYTNRKICQFWDKSLWTYLILRISRIYGYLTRYLSNQGTSVSKKMQNINWMTHQTYYFLEVGKSGYVLL